MIAAGDVVIVDGYPTTVRYVVPVEGEESLVAVNGILTLIPESRLKVEGS